MSNVSDREESRKQRGARIIVGAAIVLILLGLLFIAYVLANNAQTAAPGVQIVRDLLIIIVAIELFVIGVAITVFLVQVACLVNLIKNEVEPLISATSDTVNTVRGTAHFLSKNLVEPVVSMNSAIQGLAKVAGDVEALRKAAGVAVEVANAVSPTSTQSTSSVPSVGGEPSEKASEVSDTAAERKPVSKRRISKKTRKEE